MVLTHMWSVWEFWSTQPESLAHGILRRGQGCTVPGRVEQDSDLTKGKVVHSLYPKK